MKTTEERLEALERSVRRWRTVTAILALIAVGGATLAAAKSDVVDVIRCRGLEVVDENGQWVVSLDAWTLGGRLDIRNAEGKVSTTISQSDNGNGMLKVYSRDQEGLIFAGAEKTSGDGFLAVLARDGRTLVSAGADAKGDGGLEVYRKDGEVIAIPPAE